MKKFLAAGAALCLAWATQPAGAADFSFSGNITEDDDVLSFSFTVGAASNVTLRTWSYAGGVNAAGTSIARGGFDPILALFDSTGALIDQNDDGGCALVASDALTGACFDTFLTSSLAAGTYVVTVMEYDNFALGPNLSDGFAREGQGNFTTTISCGDDPGGASPFHDVTGESPGCLRDSHWAFDILNVTEAVVVAPEPATLAIVGAGLALLGWSRRRSR